MYDVTFMKLARFWMAALALAWPLGCSRPAPPDVILVVIDTLRADHVSSYGYGQPTTPALDDLARAATRYTQGRSTAPWTVPSHASLFTGLLPFEHGADAYRNADGRIIDSRPLDAQHWTLAEALQAAGYRTGGFVANQVYLSEKFGFRQGFDVYSAQRLPGGEIVAAALAWLGTESKQPSFAFLNLLDCHRPYNIDPLPGGRSAELTALPKEAPGALLDRLVQVVMGSAAGDAEALVQQVRAQYDHGVAQADAAVGRLIAELRRRGRFDSTLLIVTSDHGEYFGEHRLVEHSKDVYEEGVHVPLIVKRPGQTTGQVVSDPISLAAIPRLVVEQLPERLRSMTKSFPAPPGLWAEIRFSRPHDLSQWGQRFQRERVAVYADRFKLILTLTGEIELFDLAADPKEQRNLSALQPDLAAVLERKARAVLASKRPGSSAGDGAEVSLTAEEKAELERLGYLGGG